MADPLWIVHPADSSSGRDKSVESFG